MTDLKIIDELLCDLMWEKGLRPADLETSKVSCVANHAMNRLRAAWYSGEMKLITMSFARHFDATRPTQKHWTKSEEAALNAAQPQKD